MAVNVFDSFLKEFEQPITAFVSTSVSNLATYIDGPLRTAVTLYVILYGFAVMRGAISEPIMEFAWRAMRIVVVVLLATNSSAFQQYVTSLFFDSLPKEIGNALAGSGLNTSSGAPFDQLLSKGIDVANKIYDQAGITDVAPALIAGILLVFVAVGAFLQFAILLYAKVGLGVVIALGPIFIALGLFEATRPFTEAWLRQLANFVILLVLVVALVGLMLSTVSGFIDRFGANAGTAGEMVVAAVAISAVLGLSGYIALQLPTIAGGLAGGGASLASRLVTNPLIANATAAAGGAYAGASWSAAAVSPRYGRAARAAASGVRNPRGPRLRKQGRRHQATSKTGASERCGVDYPSFASSHASLAAAGPGQRDRRHVTVRRGGRLTAHCGIGSPARRRRHRSHQLRHPHPSFGRARAIPPYPRPISPRLAAGPTLRPRIALAAGRREMVGHDDLKAYFENSRRWEQDLLLSAHRSRRIAWVIAAGACALAIASVGAVAALAPLKTVEPFVIRVDNATGIVDTVSALNSTPARYDEAVTKYFLGRYVRAREGYSYPEAETNFRTISLLSGQGEQARFAAWYRGSNPESPQVVQGRFGVATVRIKAISLLADNVASVRFMKETRKGEETHVTHWVSTLTFSYANAPMSSADRLINPLGFLVSEYRADPEVVP